MPAITGDLLLGGTGDRAGGSLDQMDDDRMRRAASADRGRGVLPVHAPTRGIAPVKPQ